MNAIFTEENIQSLKIKIFVYLLLINQYLHSITRYIYCSFCRYSEMNIYDEVTKKKISILPYYYYHKFIYYLSYICPIDQFDPVVDLVEVKVNNYSTEYDKILLEKVNLSYLDYLTKITIMNYEYIYKKSISGYFISSFEHQVSGSEKKIDSKEQIFEYLPVICSEDDEETYIRKYKINSIKNILLFNGLIEKKEENTNILLYVVLSSLENDTNIMTYNTSLPIGNIILRYLEKKLQ